VLEVDFPTTSFKKILHLYFTHGCVLLRNFVNVNDLTKLIRAVDGLYTEIDNIHIYPRDLRRRDLPQFHEYIFVKKHYSLLKNVFVGEYNISEDTHTRRIDSLARGGQWMEPLGPHLDAFFHSFAFTVNFWVPFRDCGVEAPSLGVVCAPFRDILSFSGYDGSTDANGLAGEWNLPHFDGAMQKLSSNMKPEAIDQLRTLFGDQVWTPTYSLGDAMMLSNWTLHFTHASPSMTERRANIELRFLSDLTLAQVIDRHGLRPLPQKIFCGVKRMFFGLR